NRPPCLLDPLTFFKSSQMFHFVFFLINDPLNRAGRHAEFSRCLPDIAAGSVKSANMLPFPVVQLLPSTSHHIFTASLILVFTFFHALSRRLLTNPFARFVFTGENFSALIAAHSSSPSLEKILRLPLTSRFDPF